MRKYYTLFLLCVFVLFLSSESVFRSTLLSVRYYKIKHFYYFQDFLKEGSQ